MTATTDVAHAAAPAPNTSGAMSPMDSGPVAVDDYYQVAHDDVFSDNVLNNDSGTGTVYLDSLPTLGSDAYVAQNNPKEDMPTFLELANDDNNSILDESQAVTPSGNFYSYDSPGYPKNTVNVPVNEFILQYHAFDFLRVSFNGTRPDGEVVAGSRVSYMAEWWSQISVTTATVMLNGQPVNMWTRDDSAHVNYIGSIKAFDHLGPPFQV